MIIHNVTYDNQTLYEDYEQHTQVTTNIIVEFEIDSFKGSLTFFYDNVSNLTLEELHELVEEEAIRKMKLQIEKMETK